MDTTKHFKDRNQIINDVYDFDTDSIRTHLVQDHQFAISLNSDEDSVSIPARTETVMPGEIKDCSKARKMAIYIFSGSVEVMVSPLTEGDKFISMLRGSAVLGQDGTAPKPVVQSFELVAKRLQLVADGEAYIVMQD